MLRVTHGLKFPGIARIYAISTLERICLTSERKVPLIEFDFKTGWWRPKPGVSEEKVIKAVREIVYRKTNLCHEE